MTRLIAALLGVALFVAAVVTVLWVAAAVMIAAAGWWLWRDYRARADARVHRRAELAARAELQHRWYMAGDPRGTYGRYPPAV